MKDLLNYSTLGLTEHRVNKNMKTGETFTLYVVLSTIFFPKNWSYTGTTKPFSNILHPFLLHPPIFHIHTSSSTPIFIFTPIALLMIWLYMYQTCNESSHFWFESSHLVRILSRVESSHSSHCTNFNGSSHWKPVESFTYFKVKSRVITRYKPDMYIVTAAIRVEECLCSFVMKLWIPIIAIRRIFRIIDSLRSPLSWLVVIIINFIFSERQCRL